MYQPKVAKKDSYNYKYCDCLSTRQIKHPVTGVFETRVMVEELMTNEQVILLQSEEKTACIAFIDVYYHRLKSESPRKIKVFATQGSTRSVKGVLRKAS